MMKAGVNNNKNKAWLSVGNFALVVAFIQAIQFIAGISGLTEILLIKFGVDGLAGVAADGYNFILFVISSILYGLTRDVKISISWKEVDYLFLINVLLLLLVIIMPARQGDLAFSKNSPIHFVTIYLSLGVSLLVTCLSTTQPNIKTKILVVTLCFLFFFTGRRGLLIFPMLAVFMGISVAIGNLNAIKRIFAFALSVIALIFGRDHGAFQFDLQHLFQTVSTFDGYIFSALALSGAPFEAETFNNPEAGFGLGVDSLYIYWSHFGVFYGTIGFSLIYITYIIIIRSCNERVGVLWLFIFIVALSTPPLKNPLNIGSNFAPAIIISMLLLARYVLLSLSRSR